MDRVVNILIVDDHPEQLVALESIIASPKYNLIKATSGSEALQYVLQYDFALILLDVKMPDLSGLEVASIIKGREKSKYIPIIFITGIDDSNSYILRGYETGAVDYLMKPFDPNILKSKVEVFSDLYRKNLIIKQQEQLLRETERQENETAIAKLEFENFQRYRNLAEAIPHIVWRSNKQENIDYFNHHWCNYTGLTLEQSIGTGWHQAIHAEDLSRFSELWNAALENGNNFEAECRIREHTGTYRWHLMRTIAEKNLKGETSGWLGTITDIHDRNELVTEMKRAKEAALRASHLKSNFLTTMSHEIRTPLNTIIGIADLLVDTGLNEQQKGYVQVFERSSIHLLDLINNILDLSKIEAGEVTLDDEAFNFLQLTQELGDWARLTVQKKELQFSLSFDPKIDPNVSGDAKRIRQILLNILANAIKFTEKGSIHLDVRQVSCSAKDQRLLMCISDTGIGIPESKLASIFDEFTQADQSITRRYGGTGLGLAITKKLIHKMNGQINVKSIENRGTQFEIEIPINLLLDRKVEPILRVEGIEIHPSHKDKQLETLFSRPLKILLAEDLDDNRFLFTGYFRGTGHKIDFAENGKLAVEKFTRDHYDIVLMDVQMPEMDGYTATRRIRDWERNGKGRETPIIAITAHAMADEVRAAGEAGCTTCLSKPIRRSTLFSIIAKYTQ